MWEQVLSPDLRLSSVDVRRVKTVTALAVERIARWLQDGSLATVGEREQVALMGEAAVRSHERSLMKAIQNLGGVEPSVVCSTSGRLTVGLVTRLNVMWREVTISVLEDEAARLGTSATVLEMARAMVGESCDSSLVGMANRYDVMLEHLTSRLAQLGLQDQLTGLLGRSVVFERLDEALNRRARARRGVAVLFIDLDGFKEVNDEFGHDVGDSLLVAFARRVLQEVRQSDMVARIGGDEFVVVCDRLASPRVEGAALAQRIQQIVAEPFRVGTETIRITASIGVAAVSDPGCIDAVQLVAQADRAMYRAKRSKDRLTPS